MPFTQSTTTEGLHATTVNIPTTDQYNFNWTITLPNALGSATQGPGGGAGTGTGAALETPSAIVCTVRQNGSTIYTSLAGAQGGQLNAVNCTAGDVITLTLSSALLQDEQLNTVRLTLAVSEGPL